VGMDLRSSLIRSMHTGVTRTFNHKVVERGGVCTRSARGLITAALISVARPSLGPVRSGVAAGGAKLVKLQSGQHELIGGSEQDKADALDWISLFAPEIVFHHFHHFHRACRGR